MKLILLAGNSLHNKAWIEKVSKEMKPLFNSLEILDYEHWKNGDGLIDFESEVVNLGVLVEGEKKYVVFAKSAGVILTMMGVKEGIIKPSACMFLGTPINWAKELGINTNELVEVYFKSKIKTIFVQNKNDSVISSANLKEALKENGMKNAKFVEFEGNTHNYEDIAELKKMMRNLIH